MRRRPLLPGCLLGLTVCTAVACTDFDATRKPPVAKTTLGEDLYGALCDRVGASSLGEDLTGASYHAVCHKDAAGHYADTVDVAQLPPDDSEPRRLGIAKLEAMARRRADLVAALDATFPDVTIADPKNPSKQVRLHDALVALTRSITPLYDSTPFAPDANGNKLPLVPSTTQAVGRMFDAIATSDKAVSALSKLSGRLGYRPLHVGLGAIRPALAYPGLRTMTQSALKLVGPGGPAEKELHAVLDVSENELRTALPDTPKTPYVIIDQNKAQPNRPRTDLELIQTLLLAENPAFKRQATDPPRYIVARDPRGYVLVNGSVPGFPNTVAAPFTDANGDGMADVDAFGRFVDAKGQPVPVDLPFDYPSVTRVRPSDSFGRALDGGGNLLYRYIDTTQALSGSLARDLLALVDPSTTDDHETLMDELGGAIVLYGDRASKKITTPYTLAYDGFDTDGSPLVDLFYAFGQLLGDEESDDFLQWMIDLGENHEDLLARLLGEALATYANATDASKPLNAAAALPRTSTIWDEMADVLANIGRVGPDANNPRGLLEDLIIALSNDDVLGLGPAFSNYVEFKDRENYDPNDLNGTTLNLESNDHTAPHTATGWTTPPSDAPGNRSDFQKIFQMIHDANGVKACNKDGAKVHIKVLGFDMTYPLFGGTLKECDLFSFDDLGVLYVDAIVGKAKLKVNDGTLSALMKLLPGATSDQMFEDSSGITGMKLSQPTPAALNRLVFFGADSTNSKLAPNDLDPYRSGKNAQTNTFIKDLIDPVASSSCPKSGPNQTNECSSFDQTLRGRDPAAIFLFEHWNTYKSLAPLLDPFVRHGKEKLFLDLIEVLNRHWASAAHGPECSKSGTPQTNPSYCSEDGVVAYEPILADALAGDLLPAMHEFSKVLMAQQIQSTRVKGGVRDGVDVAATLVRKLFDPNEAAAVGMTDRFGNAQTVWSDGTTAKPQLTPFDLFANGLVAMDDRFASAKDWNDLDQRKAMWKHARSQLVDQFLQIDGSATSSVFHNPGIPKALPILLRALREHVNAHCPDREQGTACTWATKDMAKQLADSMGGPTFAALMNLQERIRADEGARREVEKLLTYLLSEASDADALQATLASMSDIFQILRDDPDMAPIMAAVSNAAAPDDAKDGDDPVPGLAATTIRAMQALTDPNDAYDPYRVLDPILKNLVTPIDAKQPSLTPLEVFVDTIAEVNRLDASVREQTLTPDDYRAVTGTMRDFMTSKTRGMEQFYEIVRHRDGD